MVDAAIVADQSGRPKQGSAETSFSAPGFSFPNATLDRHGKISQINGKFTWKGTIAIHTVYAPTAHPSDLSCYGRGTTDIDVRARDITLGFHESCHRIDYENYLKANPLPVPPELAAGISGSDYRAAELAFQRAFDTYFKALQDQSIQLTDEVGNRLSTYKQTHRCFTHVIP